MKWIPLLVTILTPIALISEECCSCDCDEGPSSARLSARHREAEGIGYPRGYTSLDLIYTPTWDCLDCDLYPFLDLRGHIDNSGKWATNAGVGVRYLDNCHSVVYGLNLYWDWREARHFNFHQIGGGLEVLWPCWDFRFNGYGPITTSQKTYRTGFDKFKGNQAFFEQKQELALWGVDGTLGYWLYNYGCFGIHTALGGYYFAGKHGKDLGGGLFRAKVRLTDYITLEGQASYDTEFKWLGQGELALHLPFGPTVKRCARSVYDCCDLLALEYRLVEQVERFEIPVTATRKKKGPALDPVTGEPLTFFFVDNTSNSLGTFESPFPTLFQAQAVAGIGDVIYVFPGDGTTTGMDAGITLQDRQILAGSGGSLSLATRFGTIELPAQSTTLPKISNDTDTVILGNGNTISGLEITSASDSSILGATIAGLTVQHSWLNAAFSGVAVFQFEGDFICSDTTIRSDNINLNFVLFPGRDLIIENSSLVSTENSNLSTNNFDGRNLICRNSSFSTIADTRSALTMNIFEGNNFSIEECSISTAGTGSHGVALNLFAGNNFTIQDSSVVTTNSDSQGIGMLTWIGNDFVCAHSTLSTASSSFFLPTFSQGKFICTHSTISATNLTGGQPAIDLRNVEASEIRFEYNTLQSNEVGLSLHTIQAPASGTQMIVKNNKITSFLEALQMTHAAGTLKADILNNTFIATGSQSDEMGTVFFPAVNITSTGGEIDLRYWKNTASAAGPPDVVFVGTGSTFEVQTPNLQQSGLEALNDGTFSLTDITFIPFE